MKAVYMVGPSGGGKSTLCRELAKNDHRFVHFSLDDEVKSIAPGFKVVKSEDWKIRWNYCGQALQGLSQHASPDQIYLVDTGAGALQTADGCAYFINRCSQMICISGDPDVVYQRNKEKFEAQKRTPRPFDDFYVDEYSGARRRVYYAAKITIDTTSEEESSSSVALIEAVNRILVDCPSEDAQC